ncbi:peptide deformylase [Acidisoma sp. 7E03]
MTIRPVLIFPDPRLRQPAETVTAFDDDLRALVEDLLETMRAAPGIGITGPHIGAMQRVVVLELRPGAVRCYVNPRVLWRSKEMQRHEEGSISMPGAAEVVQRPARVRVAYQTLEGAEGTEEADGLLAVCLQHEIDQLNGIFWLQRLSRLKRDMVVKRWEKTWRR